MQHLSTKSPYLMILYMLFVCIKLLIKLFAFVSPCLILHLLQVTLIIPSSFILHLDLFEKSFSLSALFILYNKIFIQSCLPFWHLLQALTFPGFPFIAQFMPLALLHACSFYLSIFCSFPQAHTIESALLPDA